MAEAFAKLTPATESAARALAELPLGIRGFGPVRAAAAAKAAKQREDLLALIRSGGAPLAQAAE
jgi:indolepyruvate ferredoxin oxidoreductase